MRCSRRTTPMLAVAVAVVGIPVAVGLARTPPEQAADREAIEETIHLYFRGDIERDVEALERAFHPSAELLTAGDDGTLDVLTQDAWHRDVRATPDRERPEPEILSVDVHGDAAIAKTRLRFSDGQFTDYLSLLELEDGWRIVNKIYEWEDLE